MKQKNFLIVSNSALRIPELDFKLRKNVQDTFELLSVSIAASEWEIVQDIKKKKEETPKTLIIDIDLCINNSPSNHYQGIRLFKYLRMLGSDFPCILFGQEFINDLIRFNPENAILLTDGAAYISLSNPNDENTDNHILKKPIDQNQLKKFFKIGVNEISHDWNNLWGIYKLWLVHKHISFPLQEKKKSEFLPANIQNILKSYEGVLYRKIHDVSEGGMQGELQQFFFAEMNNAISQQSKNVDSSIVLVDDQANEGWCEIYEHIIFGKHKGQIECIIPQKGDTVEGIFYKLSTLLQKKIVSLILLDVRLLGEQRHIFNQNDLSGIRIYEKLKRKFPKTPVLITTASGNIGIYEYFINMPIHPDGYWIKEGIDKKLNTHDTIRNYFNFINQVYGILKKRQIYIKKYLAAFESELNREHTNLLINRGFDHIRVEKSHFEELTAYIKLRKSLKKFNNCVIDTNFFLNINTISSKLENHVVNVFQSLVLLSFIFEEKLLVHEHVLAEILKYSIRDDPNYDKDISVAARRTLGLLKRLLRENKISIYDSGNISIADFMIEKSKNIYADDQLVKTIKKFDKANAAILFISNDVKLSERIVFQNTRSQKWTCETVVKTFKPILEKL